MRPPGSGSVVAVGSATTIAGATSGALWEYIFRLESRARLQGPLPPRRLDVEKAIDDLRMAGLMSTEGQAPGTPRDMPADLESRTLTTAQAASVLRPGMSTKQALRILRDNDVKPLNPAGRTFMWSREHVETVVAKRNQER